MGRIVESVLVDVDGTLIYSNEYHARAWKETLERYGVELPISNLRLLIGMGGDKILAQIFGSSLDEKKKKAITQEVDSTYVEKYVWQVKAIPGAVELLRNLYTMGIRVALATSGKKQVFEAAMRVAPVLDYCVGYTTADDAHTTKPDPAIFLAAIRKFGFEAASTVAIGDTPYDIEAAKKVPCRAIAVRTGGFPYQMLALADEQYDSVDHLNRMLHTSILAR